MAAIWPQRAWYRGRQFAAALAATVRPLTPEERRAALSDLPPAAWALFDGMSRADQRHSLGVMRALRQAGYAQPALTQAALLHDCAKREGGVQLWHRVAMVLLKAFRPALLRRWMRGLAPKRGMWRYPLWAHAHHPQRGAELAAAAGCDPLAVTLIRRHQDVLPHGAGDSQVDRLLAALQAADDDH